MNRARDRRPGANGLSCARSSPTRPHEADALHNNQDGPRLVRKTGEADRSVDAKVASGSPVCAKPSPPRMDPVKAFEHQFAARDRYAFVTLCADALPMKRRADIWISTHRRILWQRSARMVVVRRPPNVSPRAAMARARAAGSFVTTPSSIKPLNLGTLSEDADRSRKPLVDLATPATGHARQAVSALVENTPPRLPQGASKIRRDLARCDGLYRGQLAMSRPLAGA